jgi:hypothetical protein
MASRFRRPSAAALVALATSVAALLPPAHIHLAIGHDDHDHDHHAAAVEHSHWSAHHSSRASFDDDDGRVIFVDRPATSASAETGFARPPAVLVALISLASAPTFTVSERQRSGNSPRDGPVRAVRSLRAPPSFDTLD